MIQGYSPGNAEDRNMKPKRSLLEKIYGSQNEAYY